MNLDTGEPWYYRFRSLIENCFGPCGLTDEVYSYLDRLPTILAEYYGGSDEYWLNKSRWNRPPFEGVVEAALKWACKTARAYSEKYEKDYCYYLSRFIRNGNITKYIINLLRIYQKTSNKK